MSEENILIPTGLISKLYCHTEARKTGKKRAKNLHFKNALCINPASNSSRLRISILPFGGKLDKSKRDVKSCIRIVRQEELIVQLMKLNDTAPVLDFFCVFWRDTYSHGVSITNQTDTSERLSELYSMVTRSIVRTAKTAV